MIDKCKSKCPRGYELEVEIVAPDIAGISITEMRGNDRRPGQTFPVGKKSESPSGDGGTIDIRSMTVDSVTALIDRGGRIFTKPQSAMIASVRQGGNVTYWGDVQVTSLVRHGGVVTKGSADEASKPLSDFGNSFQSVPPAPPLPPIPVQQPRSGN